MSIGVDELPWEILMEIFSYLSFEELRSVLSVNDCWRQAAMEKHLWKPLTYSACGSSEVSIEQLKLCPRLQNVDLFGVCVSEELLQFICDHCPDLQHLYISWSSINNIHEGTIIQPLRQIKTLTLSHSFFSDIDFPKLDFIFPNLESLDISKMCFKDKDALTFYVRTQHSLCTLAISCSASSDDCVLPVLSKLKTLKELTLLHPCEDVETLSAQEVEPFANITALKIYYFFKSRENANKSLFRYFPNIETLELRMLPDPIEEILQGVYTYCPRLKKLCLCNRLRGLQNDIFKYVHLLRNLTHLSIFCDEVVTDKCVENFHLIPQLTHLELFRCYRISIAILNVICGFRNLQVLRFDLKNRKPPDDFSAANVSNKNLQIWFYNCKKSSFLDSLRQQHLRIGIAKNPYREV